MHFDVIFNTTFNILHNNEMFIVILGNRRLVWFYLSCRTKALDAHITSITKEYNFNSLSKMLISVMQVDFILYDTESTRLIDFVIGQFGFQ